MKRKGINMPTSDAACDEHYLLSAVGSTLSARDYYDRFELGKKKEKNFPLVQQ